MFFGLLLNRREYLKELQYFQDKAETYKQRLLKQADNFLGVSGENTALTLLNDRLKKEIEDGHLANSQLSDELNKVKDELQETKELYINTNDQLNLQLVDNDSLSKANEELQQKLEKLEAENIALKTNSQFLTEKIFNIEDLAKAIIVSLDV